MEIRLRMIVPVGLTCFALALLPATGADDKKGGTKAAKETTTPGKPGMMVVKDAETGQLRAPTAEEAAALIGVPQASSTTPQTFAGPNGAVGVVLDDSTLVFAVAKKNPDGTVTIGEATGPEAAKAAVTAPKPKANEKKAPPSAKGAANDR